MAVGQRLVSDVLTIMRRAIGRTNANDPDSTDDALLQYINDFVSLSMSKAISLYENFSTLTFDIDETTDGVYTFNDVGASDDFMSISNEVLISLTAPARESVSWQSLLVSRDPGEFFDYWGINNEDILVKGFPTHMLYYGNAMTFRTIPDTDYTVKIYGYKKNNDYVGTTTPIQFDYWLRYIAYGAAFEYATDFHFESDFLNNIFRAFQREQKLMLNQTHNQIKYITTPPAF